MKRVRSFALAMLLLVVSIMPFSAFAYAEGLNRAPLGFEPTEVFRINDSVRLSPEANAQNAETTVTQETSLFGYDAEVVGRVIFGVCVSIAVILLGVIAIIIILKLKERIG